MSRATAVGVGGTGGWQALAWASEQALLTSTRLVILHACPPGSSLARQPGTPQLAFVELIDPPLARAVRTARGKLGARNVSLRILEGDPGTALVEASAADAMLVLGPGSGGSTVRRVIRRASCPVVVACPDPGDHGAPFAGQVVLGVDAGPAGDAAVKFAFEYAEQHRVAVAAARIISADRSAEVSRAGDVIAATDLLRNALAPWRLKYPHVQVLSTVMHGAIDSGLLRAGAGARLLVIGDRRRGPLGRARTGDLPLTVARGARCPVAVVPAGRPAPRRLLGDHTGARRGRAAEHRGSAAALDRPGPAAPPHDQEV
jgi:nucleotide-binding universal stress UspA family protein